MRNNRYENCNRTHVCVYFVLVGKNDRPQTETFCLYDLYRGVIQKSSGKSFRGDPLEDLC